MKITDIRDEGYRLLDINSSVTVSDAVKADCANALNRALQVMSLAGGDYFLMESLTQAITAGQAEYVLATNIQRLIGPMRLQGGAHLRELRSRGFYDGFTLYFQGAAAMGPGSGSPLAYFLETDRAIEAGPTGNIVVAGAGTAAANGLYRWNGTWLGIPFYNITGNAPSASSIMWSGTHWIIFDATNTSLYSSASPVASPDLAAGWALTGGLGPVPTVFSESALSPNAVKTTLCLAPTPVAEGALEFDAIRDPGHYSAADMADSGITIPVAHQFTENLLVPLVKYFLSRSRFFTNAAKLPLIEADYQAAMTALGLGDPVQDSTRKTDPQMELP